MASDVPADLVELLETLGQDNVRRLSVRLLIDLLTLEKDPARAPELARDVAALSEDLLLAGDYESTLAVVTPRCRARRRTRPPSPARAAGSRSTAWSARPPFVETAELLGDMAEAEAAMFADICARIGAAATDALKVHLETRGGNAGTDARDGDHPAVRRARRRPPQLAGRLEPVGRAAQRRGAARRDCRAPRRCPLLQPLLRGQDARVTAAAVRALSNIKDPAAARAVHTVLRAATGDQRRAVVDALVAQRDARVVPVLVRILEDSDPFGADHAIVLETLGALAQRRRRPGGAGRLAP